jgi:CRISPR-associated protein Cmr3
MSKETWIVEPRDALIVRDGRPFGNRAGTRAKSVDFPFPSTTSGGARTRAGLGKINGDLSKFDKNLGDEVLQIEVSGPLLAEVDDGGKVNLLIHAPADCLIVKPENEGEKNRFPLAPLEKDADSFSNLDDDLHLLGTTEKVKGKPQSDPHFWHWAEFEQWLLKADEAQTIDARTLGHNGLTKEQRTHVRILDETKGDDRYKSKANSDGGLFQTRGLEFTATNEKKQISSAKKLALVIEVERQNFGGNIESGIAPLGGERRIVAWSKSNTPFPECPLKVREAIPNTKSCRLILLTPAIFENGFKPTWLKTANGLAVEIQAIAVNRAQVISGWDFVKKKPKPTRRMCPAGTVLFLKLSGDDIESWIENTWFHCVSDLEQDRKDGFGLAALGTWDGNFLKIEEALKR